MTFGPKGIAKTADPRTPLGISASVSLKLRSFYLSRVRTRLLLPVRLDKVGDREGRRERDRRLSLARSSSRTYRDLTILVFAFNTNALSNCFLTIINSIVCLLAYIMRRVERWKARHLRTKLSTISTQAIKGSR